MYPNSRLIGNNHEESQPVGLEMSEEDQNLPYLCWIPKLHKSSYKDQFIACSSKCSTKDL